MSDSEERGPGPSLEPEAPVPPREPDPFEPAPSPPSLASELGQRVPDWAPIAAVVLLVVLGVAALAARVL